MKNSKSYKFTAALLTTILLLSSCGQAAPGTTTSPSATSDTGTATSSESTKTDAETPRKITIAYPDLWVENATLADDHIVWDTVEKNLNIDIEWELAPGNEYATVYQTRLAAGEELPDIFKIPGTVTDAMKYASQGLLLPFNDYLPEHGKNITKLFEEYPAIEKGVTTPNGKIYFTTDYLTGINAYGLGIRKDWLDKLEMDVPETMDDWYNYFVACKTTDLNGQGVGTIVPFGGKIELFMPAFGLTYQQVQNYYYVENGKIYFNAMKDEYKDYLTFMNKLYNEGMLDPMFGAGQSQIEDLRNRNCVASNSLNPGDADMQTDMLKNYGVEDAEVIYILPPLDSDGNLNFAPIPEARMGELVAISSKTENPELAMDVIDYLWANEEGVNLMTAGVEGVHWNYNDKNEMVFTDDMIHNPDYGVLIRLRQEGTFHFLNLQTDRFNMARAERQFKAGLELLADNKDKLSEVLPTMLPDEDQQKVITEYYTDITTYIDEMQINFITGKESLDNFDAFRDKLRELGVEELTATYQEIYDRSK